MGTKDQQEGHMSYSTRTNALEMEENDLRGCEYHSMIGLGMVDEVP